MSNERKSDGGLAFPMWDGEEQEQHYGLTKREWFAGMALSGFCANPNLCGLPKETFKLMSEEQADAMLKEGVK